MLCCCYTLTDFPISIRLTSLALWQSNDCPSASKATLMNMDKYFMCIHYEQLHNHNKAKHNKTVCIFLRIYCTTFCFYKVIYLTLYSLWSTLKKYHCGVECDRKGWLDDCWKPCYGQNFHGKRFHGISSSWRVVSLPYTKIWFHLRNTHGTCDQCHGGHDGGGAGVPCG